MAEVIDGKDPNNGLGMGNEKKTSRSRSVLSQVIANTVKNFLLFDNGLSSSFPTVLISSLFKSNDGSIQMSANQASWLGSMPYLFKLCGSVLSGWITEPLGRKKALIIINIPHLIAWCLLYKSSTLSEIFIANAIFGLGVGLMKAPCATYAGEICEPSVRGVLISLNSIAITLGTLLVQLLWNLIGWRDVALMGITIPIITMVAVSFVPETPIWLLSRKREKEAKKSLQWLRGWAPEKEIRNEFDTMKKYHELANACSTCKKSQQKCDHPLPTLKERFKEMWKPRTLKPAVILLICCFASQFAGMNHITPFIVQILEMYQSSVQPEWGTVVLSTVAFFGTIAWGLIVKFVGKRRIFLCALAGCSISLNILGLYGFYYLPFGIKSFDKNTMPIITTDDKTIIPMVVFIVLKFCTTGIIAVPFMMFSELFPFKTRSLATGCTTAINFIIVFISHKSFINIEDFLTLPGSLIAYGLIGIITLIVTYNILPETENFTLDEIEMHFSDDRLKLTDRTIKHFSSSDTPSYDAVNSVQKQNAPDSHINDDNNLNGKTKCESDKL